MRLRLLKVIVQPVLVREDDAGELEEVSTQPQALSRSQLAEFANGGLDRWIAEQNRGEDG